MPAHVNSSSAEWWPLTGLPLGRDMDTVGDREAGNPKKLLKQWPDGVFVSPRGGIPPQLCKRGSPQTGPIILLGSQVRVCTQARLRAPLRHDCLEPSLLNSLGVSRSAGGT